MVITRTAGSNSEAISKFLQELESKQGSRGRYYIWRGNSGRIETNMPEAIRRKEQEQLGEEEGQEVITESIREMMINTRRLTRDREGLSVGEEVNFVGRDGEFYDELSGGWLDPERVKQARIEEMEEFRKHKVYEKVTIQECWDKTGGNPIGVKWADVNKGGQL